MSKFSLGDRVYRTHDPSKRPRTIIEVVAPEGYKIIDDDGLSSALIWYDDELTLIEKAGKMQTFQVGEKVKVIGNDSFGHIFNIGEIVTVEAYEGDDSYRCINTVGCSQWVSAADVEPIQSNLFSVGDVLVNESHSFDRVVQGVMGNLVFTTDADDDHPSMRSEKQLLEAGWSIKDTTDTVEVTELTMDQIAEKVGVPVEQLRVKKEES